MMGRFFVLGCRIANLSGCILLATSLQAYADTQAIRASDNAAYIALGASFLNYKESIPAPFIPDSERGALPSFAGGVSILGNQEARDFTKNLYFAVDGSVSWGNATYNGAYLATPTTPLQTNTDETRWTIGGKLGRAFPIGPAAILTPYLDVGYRYWSRDLGSGQVENYQHVETLGGLMAQIAPTQKLVLTGYVAVGTTISPSMTTGGQDYSLGDAGIYKVGGKVGYAMTQKVELFTTLDFDAYHYGHSSVQSDGTYEPGSRTSDTNWRVGLAYHFK